jgi:hypothetical protein
MSDMLTYQTIAATAGPSKIAARRLSLRVIADRLAKDTVQDTCHYPPPIVTTRALGLRQFVAETGGSASGSHT